MRNIEISIALLGSDISADALDMARLNQAFFPHRPNPAPRFHFVSFPSRTRRGSETKSCVPAHRRYGIRSCSTANSMDVGGVGCSKAADRTRSTLPRVFMQTREGVHQTLILRADRWHGD